MARFIRVSAKVTSEFFQDEAAASEGAPDGTLICRVVGEVSTETTFKPEPQRKPRRDKGKPREPKAVAP